MPLRSQDIIICLKLATWSVERWSFEMLATSLGLSVSETHAGVERLRWARLIDPTRRPLKRNFQELLTSGVKYFYPAKFGGQVTGMPTAYAAAPLKERLLDLGVDSPSPVWPWPEGIVYGVELKPLYRTVPFAADKDAQLHELLVLVDGVRLHMPRVSRLSAELLHERIEALSAN
jgi:hypothetical protein